MAGQDVRVFGGATPLVAAENMTAAAKSMPDEIVSATWADGAFVVVTRPKPDYDFTRVVFALTAAAIVAYAGLQMVQLRSVGATRSPRRSTRRSGSCASDSQPCQSRWVCAGG